MTNTATNRHPNAPPTPSRHRIIRRTSNQSTCQALQPSCTCIKLPCTVGYQNIHRTTTSCFHWTMRQIVDGRACDLEPAFQGIGRQLVVAEDSGSMPSVVAAAESCSQDAFLRDEAFPVVELGQHVEKGLRESRTRQRHRRHFRCRPVREH
jgi:hypothetical protein